MPGTPDRLLDEAERLFARQGIDGVTTRELTEAAGQRNASAVSYHFGSRDGLVRGLLARRGGPIDEARGRHRDALGATPSVAQLVRCLVDPWAESLLSPEGRAYVQIVDQLRGRFAAWRTESDATTSSNLTRILDELEAAGAGAAVGPRDRERLVGMIVMLTGTTADRARRIEAGEPMELGHDAFVDLLVRMCTAVVLA
ncbi:MAG: helix-turn-helix domain-containing protein [Microthrixaceae bacterium]